MGLKTYALKPISAAIELARTLTLSEVTIRDRVRLVMLALRAWSRIARSDFQLDLFGYGSLFFSQSSLNSDWNTFSEIFLSRCYSTNFDAATVIDVGAHKGYFGAYVLIKKARSVLSFEPESSNFAALRKTAESFETHGHKWSFKKGAVGDRESSSVQLHVSAESWTHSLLPSTLSGRRKQVASESVPMVSLQTIISQAIQRPYRIIVKIDIEGAECLVVLGTPTDVWRLVDEVFIETHPFAPCSADSIVQHLEISGLTLCRDSTSQVAHLRRKKPT